MSFQICIKTEKSLQQLATEIRTLFSLPPFKLNSSPNEDYCQFETLGMLILIYRSDEEDRDPEVMHYPYCFDIQFSFADHDLDTDSMEYRLQPYYAQLLSFHLGLETAYSERQRVERSWHIRYHFCSKNPKWSANVLFGEPGWEPAVIEVTPSPWRNMRPVF
jgi:glucose-6-phosphate 1-dehydrogenase